MLVWSSDHLAASRLLVQEIQFTGLAVWLKMLEGALCERRAICIKTFHPTHAGGHCYCAPLPGKAVMFSPLHRT